MNSLADGPNERPDLTAQQYQIHLSTPLGRSHHFAFSNSFSRNPTFLSAPVPCVSQGPCVMMVQPTQATQAENSLSTLTLRTTYQYPQLQEGTSQTLRPFSGPQTKKMPESHRTDWPRSIVVEGLFWASAWASTPPVAGSATGGHNLRSAKVGWGLPGSDSKMGSSRRYILRYTRLQHNQLRTSPLPQPTAPAMCRALCQALCQLLLPTDVEGKVTFSESQSTEREPSRTPTVLQWRWFSGCVPYATKLTRAWVSEGRSPSQNLVQASLLLMDNQCNLKNSKQWSHPVWDRINARGRRKLLETQMEVLTSLWAVVIFCIPFTD